MSFLLLTKISCSKHFYLIRFYALLSHFVGTIGATQVSCTRLHRMVLIKISLSNLHKLKRTGPKFIKIGNEILGLV